MNSCIVSSDFQGILFIQIYLINSFDPANIFRNDTTADEIYQYPIFECVAAIWLADKSTDNISNNDPQSDMPHHDSILHHSE